jgi:hypothetical protein
LDSNPIFSESERIELQQLIDENILHPFYEFLNSQDDIDANERASLALDMTKLIYEFEDVIRSKAMRESAAKYPAYVPTINTHAEPWVCPTPRYSEKASQAAFELCIQHIDMGHWEKVTGAVWCSPLMMVAKPGADPPFRPTVNMKVVNQRLILPINYPFPTCMRNS